MCADKQLLKSKVECQECRTSFSNWHTHHHHHHSCVPSMHLDVIRTITILKICTIRHFLTTLGCVHQQHDSDKQLRGFVMSERKNVCMLSCIIFIHINQHNCIHHINFNYILWKHRRARVREKHQLHSSWSTNNFSDWSPQVDENFSLILCSWCIVLTFLWASVHFPSCYYCYCYCFFFFCYGRRRISGLVKLQNIMQTHRFADRFVRINRDFMHMKQLI